MFEIVLLVLLLGIHSCLLSMVVKVDNVPSFLFFKGVPFILGLTTILYALKELGVI